MGYAGGDSTNPEYHNLGNHTETLEVDFDPTKLSFEDLLKEFWSCHNPFSAKWNRQYMTAFFWRNAEQRASLEADVAKFEEQRGAPVTTELLPFEAFYLAEDYHQKYMLRRHREFVDPLLETYPDLVEFVNSTAATRLNGYLAGHGSREAMALELPLLGLDEAAQARLLQVMHT